MHRAAGRGRLRSAPPAPCNTRLMAPAGPAVPFTSPSIVCAKRVGASARRVGHGQNKIAQPRAENAVEELMGDHRKRGQRGIPHTGAAIAARHRPAALRAGGCISPVRVTGIVPVAPPSKRDMGSAPVRVCVIPLQRNPGPRDAAGTRRGGQLQAFAAFRDHAGKRDW